MGRHAKNPDLGARHSAAHIPTCCPRRIVRTTSQPSNGKHFVLVREKNRATKRTPPKTGRWNFFRTLPHSVMVAQVTLNHFV